MFKIFDRNHKQIDILENPYNAIITDELNGIGELKFTVPITYKKLQLEGYVQVKDGHEYVIKEITTEGRERNVHCVLNIEELLGMVHTTFTSKENNLNDTMKIILNGTTWTHVNNSTRTYTRNLYGTVVSSYHMLQLMSTVFDVEFYFDSHKKIVYIVDRVGEDNGTYFINDLNLKQLNQDTHTHNLITRVIPLGKDNLNISEVNGGKMWLENHTYSNKIIYGVWQVTDYDNATKLKEDAQRYLNEMAIPYESYEIQVTDISKLANNPDFNYELGDVITIIDNLSETRVKQRIYRKVYNLQDPDADVINIASKDKSFEDYYKRIQTVADMTDKVINTDGTINSEAIDKVPADKIIGEILGTSIKVDSITADHIKAEQIQSRHITADAISANHIKANSIQTNHLQANSIASEHIQTGAITAGSGIIADGAIGNAQISNLDASKLTAGIIDTSDITIAGANQNLRITGNRLQVFEGVGNKQKERVSLGDVNADGSVYGIRVRGRDGTTVLFDDNGVTKEGITDGSITNDKINPNANINASKIDIDSVINRINKDGSTTIQGTRIDIDNKSLSAVISEINTKNTAQDNKISSQASSITANTNAIKLKVDTQTYTTDKSNMTTQMNKNTSEISTMKNQIALKVEQSDINTAVNSLNNTIDSKINSAKSEIKITTDGITSTVSNLQQGQSTLTQRVDGFEFNVQNSSSSNLLYDSEFKKGTTYWWHHNYIPEGYINTQVNIAERWSNPDWIPHNTNVIQVRCTDNWYQSNFERGMMSVWIPVLPHKTYTLTFYHACHRGRPYVTIRNAHNSGWITHRDLPSKSGGYLLNDNWGYETLTFNVGETDNIRVEFGINENYGDSWAWFCKPMLVEGSVGQKHSPHAGEVYNGVTIIDSQGVRVTHSNGDFSQMTADGFKRHRTDGGLKGDYHYLMQSGTIYCNSEQYVRIYLPEDFHWKKLNAVACASCIGTGSDAHEKPEPLISFWAEVNSIASDSSWVEFYASTRQNRNGSVLTTHKGIKFAYWITA